MSNPEISSRMPLVQMAEEINKLNAQLVKKKRPYLLVGPGQVGSLGQMVGNTGEVAKHFRCRCYC